MATATHGSVGVFKLADASAVLQDITTYLTSNGLSDAIDSVESTHLGDTAKEYVPGLEDHTYDLGGNADPTIDGQLWGIRRKIVAFEYYPFGNAGTAGTNVKYAGNCLITSYDRTGGVSALVTFTAKGQVTGAVTRSLI